MKTRKFFLLYLLLLLTISGLNFSFAQELHTTISEPVYKGGLTALKEFIIQNMHYRGNHGKNGIPVIVTVSYTINEKGKIENIKILRGIDAECDSEAVRITSLITEWQPAVQGGKSVSIRVSMNIEFCLKNVEEKEKIITLSGNVSSKTTGKSIEGSLILVKGTSIGAMADEKRKLQHCSSGREI